MHAAVILALLGFAWAAPTPQLLTYSNAPVGLTYVAAAPVSYATQYHAQDELGQVNYGFAHPGQAKNEVRDAFGNVAGSYSYIDVNGKPVVVEYTAGTKGFQVKSNNLPEAAEPAVVPLPVAPEDTAEVTAAKAQFAAAFIAAQKKSSVDPIPVVETPVEAKSNDPVEEKKEEKFEAPSVPEEIKEEEIEAPSVPEEIKEEEIEAPSVPEEIKEEEIEAPSVPEEIKEEEIEAPSVPEEIKEEEIEAPSVVAPVEGKEEKTKTSAVLEAPAKAPVATVTTYSASDLPISVQDTKEVAEAKLAHKAAFDLAAAAAAAAPDFDLDGGVSRYSGYLSTLNGALSPFFTNTYSQSAFGPAQVLSVAPFAPVHYTTYVG